MYPDRGTYPKTGVYIHRQGNTSIDRGMNPDRGTYP